MSKDSSKQAGKLRTLTRFLFGWIGIFSIEIFVYLAIILAFAVAIYFEFLDFP